MTEETRPSPQIDTSTPSYERLITSLEVVEEQLLKALNEQSLRWNRIALARLRAILIVLREEEKA